MRHTHYQLLQIISIVLFATSIHTSLHATTNYIDRYIIAWHEAGHAVAMIHNDTAALVNHVSIQPQYLTNLQGKLIHTQGHVMSMQTNDIHKSVEEFENHIISALAGPVAEQIAQSQPMIIHADKILQFLSHPSYATDLHLSRMYAQEIVRIQTFQYFTAQQIKQKIDSIIINLYIRTYKFMMRYKNEIRKMAEVLIRQKNLYSDEVYQFTEC